MSRNALRLCRVCLTKEKNQKFSKLFDENHNFAENYYILTNLSVVELKEINTPALICQKCQADLASAVKLKKIALISDKFFTKLLKEKEVELWKRNDEPVLDELFTVSEQPSPEKSLAEIKNEEIAKKEEIANVDDNFFNDDFMFSDFSEISEPEWSEEKIKPAKKIPAQKKPASKKKKAKKRYTDDVDDDEDDEGKPKRRYTKGGYKKAICNTCGKNLNTIERLNLHIAAIHEIIPYENYLSCPHDTCNKRFKLQYYLNNHLKNFHDPERKKRYQRQEIPCSYCGKILSSITAATQHEMRHTIPNYSEPSFFCDLCGFGTNKLIRLRYHIDRVHLKLRKYKCKYCEETFVHASLRMNHELGVHLNERKWVCRFNCGKAFVRSHCRTIHERIHTNIRPYSCHFCDKTFIHHSDNRRHQLRHTGGIPIKIFLEQMKKGVKLEVRYF